MSRGDIKPGAAGERDTTRHHQTPPRQLVHKKMDTSQLLLLLLIFMAVTPSECSGSAKPPCKDFDVELPRNLLEGEAFYFEPYALDIYSPDDKFTWFRKNINSQTENITSDKNETVHYVDEALFFLNLRVEDSGFYTARQLTPSGKCYNYYVNINVFKPSSPISSKLLYVAINNSDLNKNIPCPDPIQYACETLHGNFTWNKDSVPLKDELKDHVWIYEATKVDEGIYTCICTWTYNGKEYKSSGSRRLTLREISIHRDVLITSPENKEQFVDEGGATELKCSVTCGTNVIYKCNASWLVDGVAPDQIAGYSQTTETVNVGPAKKTVSTAVLTIDKVSAKDFNAKFQCRGKGAYGEPVSVSLNLKHKKTITPLVSGALSVLFFCVFAAVLVKYFAIDLALFFRPCLPLSRCDKDGRVFDAYVVYQMQSTDKVTEEALDQFVAKILPSVLEDKCGYRLFIHGRDDIPGEDRLELVEDRMKQSRRLMVILTPDSGSESESSDQQSVSPQNPLVGGFDWQVGLHHALLQREMSVILIQLGDQGPQGYTHLPAGLQHLILKSAPIRWPQGSRGAATWNSRFWKRVRYLMPATPAKRCPQSAVI